MIGTSSSIATFALSVAPGMSNVAPIPKGLSVLERIACIAARVSSAFRGPVARIPTPPGVHLSEIEKGIGGKGLNELNMNVKVGWSNHTHMLVVISPAFETALTSVTSEIQDIPGSISGYLQPNREVILVRTELAATAVMVKR